MTSAADYNARIDKILETAVFRVGDDVGADFVLLVAMRHEDGGWKQRSTMWVGQEHGPSSAADALTVFREKIEASIARLRDDARKGLH